MKEDGLDVLSGDKQQELQKKISVVQASIEMQKKENHQLKLKVYYKCVCGDSVWTLIVVL